MVGHSLGAGTAALFSIMARSDEEVRHELRAVLRPMCLTLIIIECKVLKRGVAVHLDTWPLGPQHDGRSRCETPDMVPCLAVVVSQHQDLFGPGILEHVETNNGRLLCAQLGPKLRADTMQCVTFATPPVVTRDVAIACEDYVTTVVHQVYYVPWQPLLSARLLHIPRHMLI